MSAPLVEILNASKTYVDNPSMAARLLGASREIRAVRDVSFNIYRGETVGLVGESGCGKSTLAKALMCLERISDGQIEFDGFEITSRRERDLQWFRRRAQIVFQDPQSSLNRALRIESILEGPIRRHRTGLRRHEMRDAVAELLRMVGLDPAFIDRYPHELSGGQRQRVGIARAISVQPEFLVLDEPVSALDVSIQAQVVNLLRDLQERLSLTYLFISHDLNVVRYLSDRIAVMYLGRIVEIGPAERIYADPKHPYTQLLLSAVAHPDPALRHQKISVQGEVPSPMAPPPGCPFHPRCAAAHDRCRRERPLPRLTDDVTVACHLYEDGAAEAA